MKPLTDKPFSPDLLADPKYFWNRKTLKQFSEPFNGDDHSSLLAICQHNKEVFTLISTTLPTMDGWCTVEKGCAIAGLVIAMRPETVVEIGTYAGRSFLPMLFALRANARGQAVGIDPYDARISSEEEYPGNSEWWASVDHGLIEKKFHAILRRLNVMQWCRLYKSKSDSVEPMPCGLLHIDGNHCETALRDAQRFGPKVNLGGIVVLDDIMWVGGSVLRAIDALEEMGFKECYRRAEENWCVMQRCK